MKSDIKLPNAIRVLMFGWEFPPHISGGLGTACFGITNELIKQNVDVLFVVPKLHGDEEAENFKLLNAGDVFVNVVSASANELWKKLTYLQVHSSLVPYISPEEFTTTRIFDSTENETVDQSQKLINFQLKGGYGKNLMQEISRYAFVATEIAKDNDFDVIHVHDWLTFPAGIAAKETSKKPLIVHVHATEFDRSGDNINNDVFDMEKRGMEAADKIIAVSEWTRQIIINRYNIPPDKIVVVHNGVMPKNNLINETNTGLLKEKIVTFMGRITFQKGPDYFVETAKKVLDKIPNVRFVMAGNGDMMANMIKRVAELRMSSRFHFTGFLKGDEVDKMYALTDIFVMPSVSEPFGIAPLEAMQANVPVIISKQSGVSEVIKNAIKIDFWDVDELANSICSILSYKGLAQTFSKNGQEEASGITWEKTSVKIKEIYESVIKEQVVSHE